MRHEHRFPNLFIIGAMKAGTTSLSRYLGAHPEVFMTSDPKEPTYFLTRDQLLDVLPGVEKRGFWRGEEFYLELFASAGDRPVIAEASANYARLNRVAGVAERIARFNPDARIIYIMRDPVERTISHYWYMVRFFAERRDMLTAVQQDSDYTDTSYYAMQLRPYLDLFGTDRVLTVTTETLRDRRAETVASIFSWLNVDSAFMPPNLSEEANRAPPVIQQVRGRGVLHRLRNSKLWNSIGPRVPRQLRALARGLSERPVDRVATDIAAVRAYLRMVHLPQTRELEVLLGRDFPEWATLYETL